MKDYIEISLLGLILLNIYFRPDITFYISNSIIGKIIFVILIFLSYHLLGPTSSFLVTILFISSLNIKEGRKGRKKKKNKIRTQSLKDCSTKACLCHQCSRIKLKGQCKKKCSKNLPIKNGYLMKYNKNDKKYNIDWDAWNGLDKKEKKESEVNNIHSHIIDHLTKIHGDTKNKEKNEAHKKKFTTADKSTYTPDFTDNEKIRMFNEVYIKNPEKWNVKIEKESTGNIAQTSLLYTKLWRMHNDMHEKIKKDKKHSRFGLGDKPHEHIHRENERYHSHLNRK